MAYQYEVTDHPGVTHLVYDDTRYRLDALTEAQKRFLYGRTQFIRRVELPEPPAQAPAPPARRSRKAS